MASEGLPGGGTLPAQGPPTTHRRGFLCSDVRFPMLPMEESQFLVRLNPDTQEKFQVSDEGEAGEKGPWVRLLLKTDRLVVVREGRSWEWKLGCLRRYGHSKSDFYFESGRKSRTGEGMFAFDTDQGEKIHAKVAMMKEFCQFDLYCQLGLIPILTGESPSRVRSFKTRNEKASGQQGNREASGRPNSTGSLP
ncbi:Fibroblast growth factor receptor substrate 2 [Chionoecetes opilio]|uniref:Fibroblast growth factor receptor substrate 2 n=1 Tax=Chionoecetes opilio TaxID=41210 RepID=A0A8J4YMZ4_CHIOP|nr:Fibroblast growth factor receptor substrate 2 [Chionoecetes opilio]